MPVQVCSWISSNVLNFSLGDGQNLLLADSSLSRDLFPGDYHCLGDNENRPIKWMPIEAINSKKYSKASDVVRSYKDHFKTFENPGGNSSFKAYRPFMTQKFALSMNVLPFHFTQVM